MKPSGELFLERKQSRRLGVYVREASRWPRGREARMPPWARPPPSWAPRGSLIDFFCLYMSIYRKNIEDHNRSGVPPPQASVATKNLSGAHSGTLRGNPSPVAIFIIPTLSMMRREQFTLGLRVCTSSYVFDLSLSLSRVLDSARS